MKTRLSNMSKKLQYKCLQFVNQHIPSCVKLQAQDWINNLCKHGSKALYFRLHCQTGDIQCLASFLTFPLPFLILKSISQQAFLSAVSCCCFSVVILFFYQLCKCRPCLSELDCNQHAAVMKCPILLDAERKPGGEN